MTPTIAFPGLESSIWALASAVAIAATFSLERCMAGRHLNEIKADRTRLRAFRPDAVPPRLLRILRHQGLELAPGPLVLGMGLLGFAKKVRQSLPGIGSVHVDHTDRLDPRSWRFAIEEHRAFAGFDR